MKPSGFLFIFLPLHSMKKKRVIINFSFAIILLFSIVTQSFHGYVHLAKQFSEVRCHHKYNVTHTEITHQHHNFDHCYICQFTFGSYISPKVLPYQFNTNYKEIPYFFSAKETETSFSGSLYSLRGPPSICI